MGAGVLRLRVDVATAVFTAVRVASIVALVVPTTKLSWLGVEEILEGCGFPPSDDIEHPTLNRRRHNDET